MLFAKIDPPAEFAQNPTPFSVEIKKADYITAAANPYKLGATEVSFNYILGNPEFNTEGKMVKFQRLGGGNIVLSGDEISDWGLDDTVVLEKICDKLGTSAVEFEDWNPENGFMF